MAEVTDRMAGLSRWVPQEGDQPFRLGSDTPEEAMKGFRRAIHDQAEGGEHEDGQWC